MDYCSTIYISCRLKSEGLILILKQMFRWLANKFETRLRHVYDSVLNNVAQVLLKEGLQVQLHEVTMYIDRTSGRSRMQVNKHHLDIKIKT